MSFLGSVSAAPKAVNNSGNTNNGAKKKERNPSTADIRVFRNGSVYPSMDLVKRFDLDYQAKDSATPGFGFDVIDSRQWVNLKTEQPALFIAPVRRDLGKVDLFGSCTFDTENNPASNVIDQGATTFGKKLLSMISEIYDINIKETDEKDYIDLHVVEIPEVNAVLKDATKGVLHFPKTVSRGEDKGTATYVRRENATVYGFVPAQLMSTEEGESVRGEATEDTTVPMIEDVLNHDLANPANITEQVPASFEELQQGLSLEA